MTGCKEMHSLATMDPSARESHVHLTKNPLRPRSPPRSELHRLEPGVLALGQIGIHLKEVLDKCRVISIQNYIIQRIYPLTQELAARPKNVDLPSLDMDLDCHPAISHQTHVNIDGVGKCIAWRREKFQP